jgi:hypothetical protein
MTPSEKAARDEFARRVQDEQDKAVRKYGPDALLPAGRPDYDITDYATNELVGLVRYGAMIQARGKMMIDLMEDGLTPGQRRDVRTMMAVGKRIAAAGQELGEALLSVRQQLKSAGLVVGTTEKTQ